jgi:hypothetical protein
MSRGFWCARSLGKLGLCTLGPCLGQSTLVALLLLGKEPAPVAGRQGLGTAALAGFSEQDMKRTRAPPSSFDAAPLPRRVGL